MIAEGNAGKIRKVFSELFSLRMLIAGTVCFPFYQLLEPVSYTHLDVYKRQDAYNQACREESGYVNPMFPG